MGWFSKTEDYNYKTEETPYKEIDLNVSVEYEDSKYGLHEKTNEDGSKHTTYWDEESNSRRSYDTDSDGNISRDHCTNQDIPKGESGRH